MDRREELYARMRSGEPYLAEEPILEDYARAVRLCTRMNADGSPETMKATMEEITGRPMDSVTVIPPFMTDFGRFTTFGTDVFVNFGAVFCDQGGITIGNRVKLGPQVTLVTTNHMLEPEKRRWMVNKPIVLGDDVWIGANVTVLPGVTVENGSVIGAGSVVTKDIPPMSVAVGNPARVIRSLE